MSRKRKPSGTDGTLATGTVQVGDAGRVAAFLQNELFVDIVTSLLLAVGLTTALIQLTVIEGGLWRTLGLTAVSLAVIALMRIRWWFAPSVAGALLSGTVVYHLAVRDMYRLAGYWTGFLLWARNGAPVDGFYSESGGLLLLEAALTFAAALAVFVLVRRQFAFPVMLAVTAVVLIWVYASTRANLSLALCFSVAGLIVLLPRLYARYVRKNSEGAHSRGSMQLVAVPAAILALLMAGAVIPEDTGSWRSNGLNNLVTDVGKLFGGPLSTYPDYASNFSMEMMDFQPEGERMGGPVTLSGKHVAFVNAEQPVLLRGAVRDYYTGESWWMGAPDGDFRYAGLLWRRYRREAYDLDKPVGGEAGRLFDDLTRKAGVEIRYTDNRFSTLFAAGRVRNVTFPDRKLDVEPYFNTRGELYLHLRIPQNAIVIVETTLWKPRDSEFDRKFLYLESLTASAPDSGYDRIFGRYTQLPDTLPDEVRKAAAEITDGLDSPYEKACAISLWLSEKCDYTLEPEPLPDGADFVANFIGTREGYCTYYASAMAVMARCAGLPSRYVTGFALEHNSGTESDYIATGRTAHAWAEIYFRGIGWMEFDPLAWSAEEPLNSGAEGRRASEPEPVPAIPFNRQGEGVAAGGTHVPEAVETARFTVSVPMLAFAVLGLAALYFLLRAALRAVMESKTRAFRLNRVMRRFPEMSLCMEYCYADILRQLRLLGLEPRSGETLNTFPARVDRHIRIEEGTLAEIAGVRMRFHFAGAEPARDEVEYAFRYHRSLELRLREQLGGVAYFFRRAAKRIKENRFIV